MVYGELIAETTDAYYFFYGFYHSRDYDSRYREIVFAAAAHDNDFEGIMLLVRKSNMLPFAMEAWSHNRFYQFIVGKVPDISLGRAEIDGELLLENGVNPIIYISHGGHGIRAAKSKDSKRLDRGMARIYRPESHKEFPKETSRPWVRYYQTFPMETFYKHAMSSGSQLLTEQVEVVEGLRLNVFISGEYRGGDNWARPKMPWGWFETIMNSGVPLGAWYLHPAWNFSQNFAIDLEQAYTQHRPFDFWGVKNYSSTLNQIVSRKEFLLSRNIRPYSLILLDHMKQFSREQIDYWFKALE